jgi:hypothetical protein
MQKIIRQGDVMLVRDDTIDLTVAKPEKAVRGHYILADGEATGHAHRVAQVATAMWVVSEAVRILQVKAKTTLQHEEHSHLDLDPGLYRVVRQREYSPEAIRNVAD